MNDIYPDIDWYATVSSAKQLPPRCPYANVHRCPRYYQSLALLGAKGMMTEISKEEDAALLTKWQSTDVWPIIREHATAISGSNWKSTHYTNYCPEVSYDKFGLFASMLCTYIDEIDKEAAERLLIENGPAQGKSWRWNWAYVTPMHYSECQLYSQLPIAFPSAPAPEQKKEEILSVKPGFFGISIDLRKLLTRLSKWWLSKSDKI